jgi:hypothetical protein
MSTIRNVKLTIDLTTNRETITRSAELRDDETVQDLLDRCWKTLHVRDYAQVMAELEHRRVNTESAARRAAGIRALLEDAKAHRQLTPTELDIERLVAGELAGPELEQLLRRGRG